MRVLMAVCVVGVLATGFTGVAAKSKRLPKEFKTCKRGDNACLKQAVVGAVKLIASRGVPELNVAPIDPFHLDVLPINQGAIKLALTNQEITGLVKTEVTEIKSEMDDKNFMLDTKVYVPTLAVTGDYIIGGMILVLPITGNGKNNFTVTGMRSRVILKGSVVRRDGEDFLQIDDHRVTMDVSRLHIDLQNLFNGNKLLADNMAIVINDNWGVLLDEVKPALVNAMGDIVMGVFDGVCSQVPYPSLFKP